MRIIHLTMIIHRSDRYILSEMVGPFLVSLGGLLLFILLNLILSLSDLMVDRGVGIAALIHLLVLKLPSLLVLALPVSGLFATFLGLGRLVHDREVIAFEAAGISLRRILLPILLAATLVAGADFALYNWAVPSSEHLYQQTLRGIIFRGGVPHVRANTFFKGEEGEFFYVRSYDEKTGVLNEVLVYDVTGKLFPQAKSAVTILTAETGEWKGSSWVLDQGKVYGYDHDGTLTYTGSFSTLEIAAGQVGADFLFGSRTPSEMRIGELRTQIALLRKSGAVVDDLIVECNLKVAMPFATLVFVLFGGAASLIFGWRSRAVGVVISFLLVGLFQGTLLWTQTLGRRGIISPPLGAWLPDILFGAIGIALFLQLDRLHPPSLWKHIRRMIPFFVILIAFVGIAHAENLSLPVGQIDAIPQTASETVPLEIRSDALTISSDHRHVAARGNVRLSYEKTILSADNALVDEQAGSEWRLQATGNVHLTVEDDFTLSGEKIDTLLSFANNSLSTQQATASAFSGKSSFVNSNGETHTLVYSGDEGTITYNEDGSLSRIEMTDATLTTCDCCGGATSAQPYSIETGRLILYPDQLIVVHDLTVRAFGIPVFWLPVYAQPLKETLDNPLFPAFGTDAVHGFFLKWNLPVYFDTGNYGAILFDYFTRFQEVGLGTVLHYAFLGLTGTAKVYFFPAKIGNPQTQIAFAPSLSLGKGWTFGGNLDYTAVGATKDLAFAFLLTGTAAEWNLSLTASRTLTEDVDGNVTTDDRLPEVVLSRVAFRRDGLSLTPRLSAGWYREWENDVFIGESSRLNGGLDLAFPQLSIDGFTLTPQISLALTRYQTGDQGTNRETLSFSATLARQGMSIVYTYREVNGQSPFVFDHVVSENHLSWRFGACTGIDLQVNGGVELTDGSFDPLNVTANWTLGAAFTLALNYDISQALPTSLTLSATLGDAKNGFSFNVPYDLVLRAFAQPTFQAQVQAEFGKLSLQGTFDSTGVLTTMTFASELHLDPAWGITFGGQIVAGVLGITAPSFGVYHDFYGCLRVGVESSGGQIWLYTSVLAFPEAVLRYAPITTQVKVGQ